MSKELILPLKYFNNVNKIQLILDEPLNLVPFSSLIDPRQSMRTVLAQNNQTKRLASIQSLKTSVINKHSQPKKLSALIIADPVTSKNDKRLPPVFIENNYQNFKRIKGSATEAKNIASLMDAVTIQGYKASKNEFLESIHSQKNILHFATHAFFHPEISGLSSIVLSRYDENGHIIPSSFLRALEISKLKLKTDLVVLSGCETGVNKYDNSLGLGGLTDSFLQAGAKNLIGSLWKVNDEITQKMMTKFYSEYVNGKSVEQALLESQNSIRENYDTSHPKYWAGWFLLVN